MTEWYKNEYSETVRKFNIIDRHKKKAITSYCSQKAVLVGLFYSALKSAFSSLLLLKWTLTTCVIHLLKENPMRIELTNLHKTKCGNVKFNSIYITFSRGPNKNLQTLMISSINTEWIHGHWVLISWTNVNSWIFTNKYL